MRKSGESQKLVLLAALQSFKRARGDLTHVRHFRLLLGRTWIALSELASQATLSPFQSPVGQERTGPVGQGRQERKARQEASRDSGNDGSSEEREVQMEGGTEGETGQSAVFRWLKIGTDERAAAPAPSLIPSILAGQLLQSALIVEARYSTLNEGSGR